MRDLQNKRILLFASTLFNYHTIIEDALRERGAEVHRYDERNNPSSVEKILLKKARFLMRKKSEAFFEQVIGKERDFAPDYVLFISPEAVTETSLTALREAFPESRFILYMWDSMKNKKASGLRHLFDDALSFDPNDCKKWGMKFRPLFFTTADSLADSDHYDYDVGFIGTVHSDRAKILLQVKDFCDKNGLSYYFYLYIPGKLLFHLRMLTNPYLRRWDRKYIHTTAINKSEVEKIQSRTRCTIDINHPGQTGLTMRTIEMLGLKRKIATTNRNVKNYDFYRPQNQIVLDRKNLVISKEEIISEYIQIPDEILHKYSLDAWIGEVFSI